MIRNPIPWPNGAKCAVAITFDMDADSLIHVAKPDDSIDRLYPISMGRYGPKVAIPRILETYKRFGLKQSFFIPGWCLETYPNVVESILMDGHEIGHHGYIHEDPINTRGYQREWFERTLESHKRICGILPRGYRAPVYNITDEVINLMIEHGMRYDSSMMADDIPYKLETSKGSLYEMPVHWGTDDWPPFAHYDEIGYMMPVKSPSEGLSGFWEEFEAQYDSGGFFMLILHPFLTGRLARWKQVEAWIEKTMSEKNIWFATLDEISSHMDNLIAQNIWKPSIEKLPYYKNAVFNKKG